MKRKFDIVYIKWEDAVSGPSEWQSIENTLDWDENTESKGHHVGIILYETKKYVLLVSELMPMTNPTSFVDTNTFSPFRIPKAWILKRKKLGVVHIDKGLM